MQVNFSALTDGELSEIMSSSKVALEVVQSEHVAAQLNALRAGAFKEAGHRAAQTLALETPKTTLIRFEVGKTYTCRSTCDHAMIFAWTVIKRTDKRLTLRNKQGDISVRGVSAYDGSEVCFPSGKYSMCPMIRASRFE